MVAHAEQISTKFYPSGKAKKNEGEKCWDKDKCRVEGDCSYCGSKGKCCRANQLKDLLSGCCAGPSCTSTSGGLGVNGHHTCVYVGQ